MHSPTAKRDDRRSGPAVDQVIGDHDHAVRVDRVGEGEPEQPATRRSAVAGGVAERIEYRCHFIGDRIGQGESIESRNADVLGERTGPHLVGAVAAGGTIGILIPPSLGFILYAILTEESIGQLFMAGMIPGILEILFYVVTIFILCAVHPHYGPRGMKMVTT